MKTIKRLSALLIVFATLVSMLFMSSCDKVENSIEKFLKADNYTIVKKNGSTLEVTAFATHYKSDKQEIYLYYDEDYESHFICTITKGVDGKDVIVKNQIGSEKYIDYFTTLCSNSEASFVAERLSAFLHLMEELEEKDEDGKYEYADKDGAKYKVAVNDKKEIIYTRDAKEDVGDFEYVISKIGKTEIDIPDFVEDAKVSEEAVIIYGY